ncbi:MAG: preprotein translocase subunit SecG [Proteobacteria bacterium]|nr:preprotein translocase subunit SecG [Pseudomonadota bacterium]
MLQQILLAVHVLLSAAIIGLVLLQRGKGADAGAGFGSGASGTVFGARGSSTFFSKMTAVLATCFFLTSLSLAYLASHRTGTAVKSLVEQAPVTAPVPTTAPAPVSELPAVPATTPATAPSTTPATAPSTTPPAGDSQPK